MVCAAAVHCALPPSLRTVHCPPHCALHSVQLCVIRRARKGHQWSFTLSLVRVKLKFTIFISLRCSTWTGMDEEGGVDREDTKLRRGVCVSLREQKRGHQG